MRDLDWGPQHPPPDQMTCSQQDNCFISKGQYHRTHFRPRLPLEKTVITGEIGSEGRVRTTHTNCSGGDGLGALEGRHRGFPCDEREERRQRDEPQGIDSAARETCPPEGRYPTSTQPKRTPASGHGMRRRTSRQLRPRGGIEGTRPASLWEACGPPCGDQRFARGTTTREPSRGKEQKW